MFLFSIEIVKFFDWEIKKKKITFPPFNWVFSISLSLFLHPHSPRSTFLSLSLFFSSFILQIMIFSTNGFFFFVIIIYGKLHVRINNRILSHLFTSLFPAGTTTTTHHPHPRLRCTTLLFTDGEFFRGQNVERRRGKRNNTTWFIYSFKEKNFFSFLF